MNPRATMNRLVHQVRCNGIRLQQIAFGRDPLVLFIKAFDPVHRIADVPLRRRHELAHFVAAGCGSLEHTGDKGHELPNGEFVGHEAITFGFCSRVPWTRTKSGHKSPPGLWPPTFVIVQEPARSRAYIVLIWGCSRHIASSIFKVRYGLVCGR